MQTTLDRRRLAHSLGLALLLAVALPVSIITAGESRKMDEIEDLFSQSPEELARDIEHKHPVTSLLLAKRLFETGKQDESVFWFYLGQLRYRAYLAAHPDLDPTGEPALFTSLMDVLGRPVNQYAFGDIPELARTLDRVLAWDDAHPDDYAPPSPTRSGVKDGLKKMRAKIIAEQDDIRANRTANGLPNREK